jgi:DNA end-binding protein Ku
VKGYEYENGKFVTVTEEDLQKINPDADHALAVLQFIDKEALDPLNFDTSYFMAPDGPLAAEVYATLRESIRNCGKYGIGKISMRRREFLVALWVKENAIVISTLRQASEMRSSELIGELGSAKSRNREEIKMAEDLIERHTKKLRLKSFKDTYQERLLAMLKDKVAAAKLAEQPAMIETSSEEKPVEQPSVIEPAAASTETAPMKRKMAKAPLPAKEEKKRKVA